MRPDGLLREADTSGLAPVSLSSFRGKYVLIDFWAGAGADHVANEEPHNVVLNYNKFKDKGNSPFWVFLLDGPGGEAKWLGAIHAEQPMTWTHVGEPSTMEQCGSCSV